MRRSAIRWLLLAATLLLVAGVTSPSGASATTTTSHPFVAPSTDPVRTPSTIAPPSSGLPAYTILGYGTYYWVNSHEVEYITSSRPWGYYDSRGIKHTYGHVSIFGQWVLSGRGDGGMLMSFSYTNTAMFNDLKIEGVMSNGAPGKAYGGAVIHDCKPLDYSHTYHGGTTLKTPIHYCLHADKHNFDHNMTIEISWHRPGRTTRWYIYIRSVVNTTRKRTNPLYRFRRFDGNGSLAGKNGAPNKQDHVHASNVPVG